MELKFGSLAALLLVASLGGGFAGAWFTSLKKEPAPRPTREVAKETNEEDSAGAADASASDEVNGRLRSLEHRVTLLTSALSKVGSNSGAEGGENPLLPGASEDVADPVFEAAVLDILDREQDRKTSERTERRTQQVAAENDRKVSLFTERLGLNPTQIEKVRQTMTAYQQKMTELRSASPESRPQSRSAWRSKMSEFSSSVMTDLSQFLSPQQIESYKNLDPDDQIASARGRGRNSDNSNSGSAATNTNSDSNAGSETRSNRNRGNGTKGASEAAEVQNR